MAKLFQRISTIYKSSNGEKAMRNNFRIYEPTTDWAGIGYNHWMIATEIDGRPESGVGHSIEEAWNDFKSRWPNVH
jgi:hypothetical protein